MAEVIFGFIYPVFSICGISIIASNANEMRWNLRFRDNIELFWLDMVIDLVEKQFQTIFSPFNPIDLYRLKMMNRLNNRFTNQAALNFQ